MTQEEAIKALQQGRRVRHRFFLPTEFIELRNTVLRDESDNELNWYMFWRERQCEACLTGWEIYQEPEIRERLEYLRTELREERISYGELAELQSLIPYIDEGDTELLEAAGVPENNTQDD